MRDLIKRGIKAAPPKGLAFEISDLILIRFWADLHSVQMLVRLDHGAEDEEYEEVIAIQTGMSSPCQSIMWRNAEAVFVQPLVGRRQQFATVAEALESLPQKPRIALTDAAGCVRPGTLSGADF